MTASPMQATWSQPLPLLLYFLLGPYPLDDDGGLVGPDAEQQPIPFGREVGVAGAGDENP